MALFVFILIDGVIFLQTKHPYWAIFSVALMTFVGILNETSMNVAYPLLARQFKLSLDVIQWITGGYFLMVTIVMGTTAYCLRQWAARRLHLIIIGAFALGNLMCALAPNFAILLGGRLVQAIATGFSTPMLFFLIFTQVPRDRLGLMNGLAGMVISLAPALGPTYGGAVLAVTTWRMIFWLLLPIALISLIIGQLTIRNVPAGNQLPFSFQALIVLAAGLLSIVIGVSQFGKFGWVPGCWLLLMLGILLLILFVYLNQRGQTRLFDLRVFKLSTIRLAAWTYFGLQFINIGMSLVIPIYCQYVLHTSSLLAGLTLLPGSLLGAVMSPLAGDVADRVGFGLPSCFGALMVVLGTLCVFGWQYWLTPGLITCFFIILRLGFNAAFANTMSTASTSVSPLQATDVNSLFNMLQQFAGSLGVGVTTALIAYRQNNGRGSLTTRTFAGSRLAFALLLVMALTILLAVMVNFRHRSCNN